MTTLTTEKEKSKQRTETLAALRKENRDKVKLAQTILKEQQNIQKSIKRALQGEPKSIPQISDMTEIPAPLVLYHVAAMKKYGQIDEAGMDEDYEYYLYTLSKES